MNKGALVFLQELSVALKGSDTTPCRRQSKTLIPSTNADKKSLETEFFDSHLSPDWRQMAIENTVSSDFFLSVFVDCKERFRLPPTRCGYAVSSPVYPTGVVHVLLHVELTFHMHLDLISLICFR